MSNQLELAPCGFIEFGEDGVIVSANGTLVASLGYSREELEGRKFESLLTLANRIFYQTHFFPTLKLQGFASEISLSLVAKNGGSLSVLTSVGRNRDIFQCVFLTFTERQKFDEEIIKARRRAEEALENNEELKAAKLALEEKARDLDLRLHELKVKNEDMLNVSKIMAHDLREPIWKVRLFGDLIREQSGGSLAEESAFGLTKILAESDRSLMLLSEIQRFLESADNNEPASTISLIELVKAAEKNARRTFADWDLHVEGLPPIFCRPNQIITLLTELLNNAVKFRSPEKRLKVDIRGQRIQVNSYQFTNEKYLYRDVIQIDVSDNGKGFDKGYKDYVFEMFKKVKLASEGFGLGLAICRRIVAAHNGSITVDPAAKMGCTFTIRLPVTQ